MKARLALLLLVGAAHAQTYTAGVTVANAVGVQVPPTPTLSVLQCLPTDVNKCWPTIPNTSTSAVLSSLPGTAMVFAIVPPATKAEWVALSSISIAPVASPPVGSTTWNSVTTLTGCSTVPASPTPTQAYTVTCGTYVQAVTLVP
jgi:hypothetical protein